MSLIPRQSRRLAAWTAATAIAGLALAGAAVAAPSLPAVSITPAGPTQATSLTANWTASTADDGTTIIGYQAGQVANAGDEPAGTVGPGVLSGPVDGSAEGTVVFRVRALQSDGQVSDWSTAQAVVDRTAPTLGAASPNGTLSADGWYRSPLSFTFGTCTDNVQITACTVPWTGEQGAFAAGARSLSSNDVAGNAASGSLPAFKFDSVAPAAAELIAPRNLVPDEPTFRWFSSAMGSDVSGVSRFLVQFRRGDNSDGTFDTLASVAPQGIVGSEQTAKRGDGLSAGDTPPPLPENVEIDWRVRVVDKAGNITSGGVRQFTIDPTVPPAPTITGGPVGPTQDTTPTFSWDGGGDSFKWDVLPAGSQAAVRSGTTAAKEVTVGALNDGAYSFRVTQFTAAGRESAEALRTFVVDTTPPAAPLILTRPTFPSVGDAVFTWTSEPGAYSRWSVVDRGGNVVVSPTDTPVTSATLPPLAEDAYTFGVQQIDAAGNVSPATVEPFTVIAPLVAPAPNTGIVTLLPRQNARRLQPKAGKTLFSRTPVLRWTRGPRGTKLFNLQIFKVAIGKNAKTPKVTKILSVFPRATAYRVPKSKTRPKTCYVWRVWPYTGREFTPKPLGVSNYCIASQRVLTKKAALVAKRKAAKVAARSRR